MRDDSLPGAWLLRDGGFLDHRAPGEHALGEGGEVEDHRAKAVKVADPVERSPPLAVIDAELHLAAPHSGPDGRPGERSFRSRTEMNGRARAKRGNNSLRTVHLAFEDPERDPVDGQSSGDLLSRGERPLLLALRQ
jgi:hypothetical protein